MEARGFLVSILKEMGTDVEMLKMHEWEIFDEILRRVHLARDNNKRLAKTIVTLKKKIEELQQVDLTWLISRLREVDRQCNHEIPNSSSTNNVENDV